MTPSEIVRALLATEDVSELLVLADALEEAGDPRGRLVAVQIALESDPANAELQREEVRLIDRNADALLGPLAIYRWDDGLTLNWRRGFVREAVVEKHEREVETLLERVLAIPAIDALDALRVGWASDFEACARIIGSAMPPLRSLAFGVDDRLRAHFEEGDLADLLTSLPKLETFVGAGGTFRAIRLPQVRAFTLLGPTRLQTLVDAEWPRLERLQFDASVRYVGDYGALPRLVDALSRIAPLRVLELHGAEEIGDSLRRALPDVEIHIR